MKQKAELEALLERKTGSKRKDGLEKFWSTDPALPNVKKESIAEKNRCPLEIRKKVYDKI